MPLRVYLDRSENAHTILLDPLTETEVETLTKAVLQTTATIHPNLLEKLTTLAQGNPSYTEQLVDWLLQNGQIALVNGAWMLTSRAQTVPIPTTIWQTVEQQMSRLSEPARQILQFAAVAGRQFDLDALQQLTQTNDAQLTALMKTLIKKQFLEEIDRDRFAFRHTLLRRAIYDSLLIRERQTLHRSLLDILEASSVQQEMHLADLSYHAYQAEAWDAALHYGLESGKHALALHSPRAAVEHFNYAAEAAKQLSDANSWELYMQRGKAYDSLAEFEQAISDYETALDLAERGDDPDAEWQTLIALALLWSSRDYPRAGEYCKRALAIAERMEDPKRVGHSLNRMGNWYLNTGQPEEGLKCHEQALAVFEELDDLPGKGETLDLLAMATGRLARWDASSHYQREAIAIFRQINDRKALASILPNLASAKDPLPAVEASELAHQIGWYSSEAYACSTAGVWYAYAGQFSLSRNYLQRARELAQAIGHTQWLANAHIDTAVLYRNMFEWARTAEHAAQTVALATEIGSSWFIDQGAGILADALIRQGQLDEADGVLVRHPVPEKPHSQHWALMGAEIDLALARGQIETARVLVERMESLFPLDTCLTYIEAKTRLLMRSNHIPEAVEVVEYGLGRYEAKGQLTDVCRMESLLGQILAQADPAAAEPHVQRVRELIDFMVENIPPEMQKRFRDNATRALLPNAKPAASGDPVTDLTAREREIVQAIALGRSNQQIAEALFITVKTVEAHITRVLSKLNLTSRTQVVLWAVEHKLTPPSETTM